MARPCQIPIQRCGLMFVPHSTSWAGGTVVCYVRELELGTAGTSMSTICHRLTDVMWGIVSKVCVLSAPAKWSLISVVVGQCHNWPRTRFKKVNRRNYGRKDRSAAPLLTYHWNMEFSVSISAIYRPIWQLWMHLFPFHLSHFPS